MVLPAGLALQPPLAPPVLAAAAEAEALAVEESVDGVGTSPARSGDLVLVHYVGALADGTVFDSTRGGLRYRDGGEGVPRPLTLRLGGDPLPGIVPGLSQGIAGMRVGGRRRLAVPAPLGFGAATVLAPYAIVPPGSRLVYDVELLRLSRQGPDALMAGVAGCGLGGASERTQGCAAITPAEFL